MSYKARKYILVIISLIFGFRVLTLFISDRFYSMSMAAETGKIRVDRGIALLNIALKLDTTNADIYFKKYELLEILLQETLRLAKDDKTVSVNEILYMVSDTRKKQLHLLEKCIDLSPSWPKYHLYYAITLKRMAPKPNIFTRRLILSELKKATTLKPYSPVYRKIYKRYLEEFDSPQ